MDCTKRTALGALLMACVLGLSSAARADESTGGERAANEESRREGGIHLQSEAITKAFSGISGRRLLLEGAIGLGGQVFGVGTLVLGISQLSGGPFFRFLGQNPVAILPALAIAGLVVALPTAGGVMAAGKMAGYDGSLLYATVGVFAGVGAAAILVIASYLMYPALIVTVPLFVVSPTLGAIIGYELSLRKQERARNLSATSLPAPDRSYPSVWAKEKVDSVPALAFAF